MDSQGRHREASIDGGMTDCNFGEGACNERAVGDELGRAFVGNSFEGETEARLDADHQWIDGRAHFSEKEPSIVTTLNVRTLVGEHDVQFGVGDEFV